MSTQRRTRNLGVKDWNTPPKYVEAVRRALGGKIFLDPCLNEYSLVHAEVEYSLPEHDGLKESWNYSTIYVNPPYGRDRERKTSIKDWLARCDAAHNEFGTEVIALVPVAPNTSHWKQHVWGKSAAICFLYDTRLKFFLYGKESKKGAPMACAMIYWGNNYERFYDAFIEHGAVVDLRPLRDQQIGTPAHSRVEGDEAGGQF